MEYVAHTARGVTEWIGGIYLNGTVRFGVGLPDVDSLLVGFSPKSQVIGWDSVPANDRPPFPSLIHLAFDLMVGIGFLLLGWGAWLAWSWWRRRDLPPSRIFLAGGALAGLAAVVAMESGWVVTEVGRQPWVVYQVLRTSQAVTPAPGVTTTLSVLLVLYLVLGVATIGILTLMGRRWRREGEVPTGDIPYGPAPGENALQRTREQAR